MYYLLYFLEYLKMPVIVVAYRMQITNYHNTELLEFYKIVTGLSEISLLRSFNISNAQVLNINISNVFSSFTSFRSRYRYLDHVSLDFLKYALLKTTVPDQEINADAINGVKFVHSTIIIGEYNKLYSRNGINVSYHIYNMTIDMISYLYQDIETSNFPTLYNISSTKMSLARTKRMRDIEQIYVSVAQSTFAILMKFVFNYGEYTKFRNV